MRRLMGCAVLALALAGAWSGPVAVGHASTVPGTAVTISGLDDLSATADTQARKGAGKVFAMLLGMGGLGAILSGRIGLGLAGVGSGLAMGFVPGMVSSAFDAAPAATGEILHHLPVSAWWTPLTAGLYPGLLLLKMVQDPVCLAALMLVLVSARHARARRALV